MSYFELLTFVEGTFDFNTNEAIEMMDEFIPELDWPELALDFN
jgi:hypothetical protein